MKRLTETFDFRALGRAIKKAREANGITREQLAETLDLAPRHIQSIENEGQHPSFQLFIRLITMFDISADQYIYPNKKGSKSTIHRQIETALDNLSEKELIIIAATIRGIRDAKEQTEE
ncbi:helix-turn-helix transcriptional regulator [Ohessyouella blattaphilus]|uniref:Helix-turn-helix transcriptional regulator n=1 Tax=Ohessyouella blattaphilus TaxID=2949333 RepID=A0ABT1EI93_9FIRM|nr:helix-turn-helix transcriptional regulator [Ohessyouella blattaphilus]MCP1110420.1 helix-turn-helix transcriptional regulator [Ohessyouella blattaphilus]MCR8563814.1 helix-turn-helix transcriptional regulator [Ohessyouella blattaphilus]MDL2249992.1 helix-turn-helix transcriptional regulator [Lachnospiraceae bacterium OttesenSCG-928-J05]